VFPSGKSYVGQSTDIKDRHFNYRRLECKSQPKLFNAITKYGWDKVKVEMLLWASDKHNLDTAETFYIKHFDCISNGYNCKEGGSNGKHSEETKKKMSEANTGKKQTTETKDKIRKTLSGRPRSIETRLKISLSKKGKPFSNEHRDNISKAQVGKPAKNKGYTYSDEIKERMSKAQLKRHLLGKNTGMIITEVGK